MGTNLLEPWGRARRLGRDLARGTGGNVALIVAVTAVPIVLGLGMGVDYTLASQRVSTLDGVADAASLAAVSPDSISKSPEAAKAVAVNAFTSQARQVKGLTITALNVSVDKSTTNGVSQTATVSWTAQANTVFASLLGMPALTLSGSSTSTASTPYYVNINVIVDISQSMGIASTAADMTALYARTSQYNGPQNGCVFGCHVPQGQGETYSNDYLAHSVYPPITLRIDSAVTAIETMLSTASSLTSQSGYMTFGIYTMSKDPVTGSLVNVVSPPSKNLGALSTLVSNITLGNNTDAGIGDTDFADQLSEFSGMLANNGTGLTPDSPLNYVFIVTDGASDVAGPCTDGHCTAVFDPNLCQPLKEKATVGVIYTTYMPIYLNNDPSKGLDARYKDLIYPFASQIAGNLQACATSSSFFYQASDGPAIVTSMTSLFNHALGQARITH